jgi:tetratricopeptide (TPR) repeat protein
MVQEHIFISYARVDGQGVAEQLYQALTAQGFPVWLDVHNIPSGADWDAEIDAGLLSAKAVVVLLSPGAVASLQVKSEWNQALNSYTPLLPLLVKTCTLPRVLQLFNYIDARQDFGLAWGQLHNKLARLDEDHLQYLRATLFAFEAAQNDSDEPSRFAPKIEELKEIIRNWSGRIQYQSERIARGLEDEKVRLEHEGPSQLKSRVVGRRPQDVTEFFKDRVHERLTLSYLLSDPNTRLVSIIGRGGMGKTAVATKVLRDLEDNHWPHAEHKQPVDAIVYLSTRTDGISADQIFLNVAKALGPAQEGRLIKLWNNLQHPLAYKWEELFAALQSGLYIILLDNLEDLLDANYQLRDPGLQLFLEKALESQHNARILVTSREPLGLKDPILRYDKQVLLQNGIPQEDAVQLLRELDPNGYFGLREANIEQLEQLAEMLHGVPRALEVAAGILANDPFMSLGELIAGFYQRIVPVQEFIEEGYKRLDPAARRIIEALALYATPVPLLAVDYLLEPFISGLDVPQICRRLTQSHLISVDRANKTLGLHPVDRDFAYSQIPEQGHYQVQALHLRAAAWYQRQRKPRNQWKELGDVEALIWQYKHLLKAAAYPEAAAVMDELDGLMSFISGKGYHARKARELRLELEGKLNDPHLQLRHLRELAFSYMMIGPLEQAIQYFEQSQDMAKTVGDMAALGETLIGLGDSYRRLGQLAQAHLYFEQAVAIFKTQQDYKNELYASFLQSLAYLYQGQMESARGLAAYIQATAQAQGDEFRAAWAYNVFALAALQAQEYQLAINWAKQTIEACKVTDSRDPVGYQYNVMGLCYLYLGQREAAVENFQQAYLIAQEEDQPRIEGFAYFNLAYLYRLDQLPESSIDASKRSQAAFETIASQSHIQVALHLRQAAEAQLAKDPQAELLALSECAKITAENPDLYAPRHIWQEILTLADRHQLPEMAQMASQALESL